MRLLSKLISLIFGTGLLLGATTSISSPLVQTTDGPIQGVEQAGAVAYLGIPYAAPPTGERRWREPASPSPWSTVKRADHFGANCPQPALPRPGGTPKSISEDCLYLNVWAPKDSATKRHPVMVWIHGGSYIIGSGDLEDTNAFTRDGVVLVSLNYRLGRLGFFAHPALSGEPSHGLLGDYGIMDQLAALKWVKANIARFGGDPDNVTIFGVSAGATFTDLLMYSPLSTGLFQKAIAESDPFFQPWPYLASMHHAGEPTAESFGARWATSVGLPNASPTDLRQVPVEKLLAGPMDATEQGVKPLIDGTILPERGPEAFSAGLAHKVPYIIGGNSYEGSLTAIYHLDPGKLVAALGPRSDAVLKIYGPAIVNNRPLLTSTISGDLSFIAPRRIAARLASSRGTPTWSYHFAYVPDALKATTPGAGHGAEVAFVFDSLERTPQRPFEPTSNDQRMGDLVHGYWVNFAIHGDPNGPGKPLWPMFKPKGTLMVFTNDRVAPVDDFEAQRLDLIEPSVAGTRPSH